MRDLYWNKTYFSTVSEHMAWSQIPDQTGHQTFNKTTCQALRAESHIYKCRYIGDLSDKYELDIHISNMNSRHKTIH